MVVRCCLMPHMERSVNARHHLTTRALLHARRLLLEAVPAVAVRRVSKFIQSAVGGRMSRIDYISSSNQRTFFVTILVSFSDRDWSTSLFSWAYYGEIATLLAVNAMSPEPCVLICSKPLRKCCDGSQRTLRQSTPSWELQSSCSTNIASFGGACMTQATVCMNVTIRLLPDTW